MAIFNSYVSLPEGILLPQSNHFMILKHGNWTSEYPPFIDVFQFSPLENLHFKRICQVPSQDEPHLFFLAASGPTTEEGQ